MFCILNGITDLEKTDENKELIRNLIKDAFMKDGNSENLENYISKEEFIEHNRDRKDGFEAFASFVEEKSLSYQEIFLMVGQGNFVATLSKARIKEEDSVQELCHVDIFRVENGKVVEHWDNSESIPDINVNSGKF